MLSYRVSNWSSYNESLVNRGDISLWFEEEALEAWYHQGRNGLRGRDMTYSDTCIELILTLRVLLKLPYRAAQGFGQGVLKLMGVEVAVPNYTTLCRRASKLDISMGQFDKESIHLVVDSTGLKIYGEGEWKARIHGKGKRRTWRKLHIAACADTHMIIAHELTKATTGDDTVMPDLLENQKKVSRVYADGAYISKDTFDAIVATGATASIPLRSGTSQVRNNPSPGEKDRNRLVREIARAGGRQQWKKKSGHHKRSVVETQMFRIKTIFGSKLPNRKFENQKTEVALRIKSLNKMTSWGMPDSYVV